MLLGSNQRNSVFICLCMCVFVWMLLISRKRKKNEWITCFFRFVLFIWSVKRFGKRKEYNQQKEKEELDREMVTYKEREREREGFGLAKRFGRRIQNLKEWMLHTQLSEPCNVLRLCVGYASRWINARETKVHVSNVRRGLVSCVGVL